MYRELVVNPRQWKFRTASKEADNEFTFRAAWRVLAAKTKKRMQEQKTKKQKAKRTSCQLPTT